MRNRPDGRANNIRPRGFATGSIVMPVFIGNMIVFFSLLIGMVVLNFALAELASRHLGSYWMWVIAFFLFPVIAHAFFFYMLFHIYREKKNLRKWQKGLQMLDGDRKRYADMNRDKDEATVTPFGTSPVQEEKIEPETPDILQELRDKKVDELMEWKEWTKAYELALERLETAEDIGDRKSMELYKLISGC